MPIKNFLNKSHKIIKEEELIDENLSTVDENENVLKDKINNSQLSRSKSASPVCPKDSTDFKCNDQNSLELSKSLSNDHNLMDQLNETINSCLDSNNAESRSKNHKLIVSGMI